MKPPNWVGHVTTVDYLPVSRLTGPLGKLAELTVAERALLDALKPRLLELMRGNGVSTFWIQERTNVGRRQIAHYLAELGAKRSSSGAGLYRIPSVTRLRSAGGFSQ